MLRAALCLCALAAAAECAHIFGIDKDFNKVNEDAELRDSLSPIVKRLRMFKVGVHPRIRFFYGLLWRGMARHARAAADSLYVPDKYRVRERDNDTHEDTDNDDGSKEHNGDDKEKKETDTDKENTENDNAIDDAKEKKEDNKVKEDKDKNTNAKRESNKENNGKEEVNKGDKKDRKGDEKKSAQEDKKEDTKTDNTEDKKDPETPKKSRLRKGKVKRKCDKKV